MKKDSTSHSDLRRAREIQAAYLIEAVMLLVLLGGGTYFTIHHLKHNARRDITAVSARAPRSLIQIPDIIEAESLAVTGKSRNFPVEVQEMTAYPEGSWSGNVQYSVREVAKGDWVELQLPDQPGNYRLVVYLTRTPDSGVVRFLLNGNRIGEDQDLYTEGPILPTGAIELGVARLSPVGNRLRIQAIDANSRMPRPKFQFGIDGLKLVAAE